MKKMVASLAVFGMLVAGLPVNAQDNPAPPPPDQQDNQGYGQYSRPGQNNGQPSQQDQGYGQYGQPSSDQDTQPSDSGQQSDQADQNQPGMARVSFLSGDVSTQRGDNAQWVAVTVNTPIATDDRVSTGDHSRAELQLDYADVLRMSEHATVKIASLSRSNVQVQIGQGLVTYTVRKGSEATVEIDTPNATIHPLVEGEYRIMVNSDSQTDVTVRRGSADIATPQGSTHVEQGQMTTIAGTDNPQYRTVVAASRDDWDNWNNDRNRRIDSAQSFHNTDRYYTGSEDLDTYGTWSEVPDYGRVWTPSSPSPDWAPYRDGRWVYEPYYGWTWVSYEPWGWAPYHYGRWFVYGSNWVWWPGPVVGYPGYYPVWSPAYVSFFGFGGVGFGVGFGFGRFGWLPCGPGDWYHPWFGRYGGRFNNVNIRNTTINTYHNGIGPLGGNRAHQFSNVNEAMRNDRVRGGISSMAGNEFGRAAVSTHQERVSEASFRQSSMVAGKMPVTPSRESFSPSNRAAGTSSVRNAASSSQHFYSAGSRTNTAAGTSRGFGNSANVNHSARVQSGAAAGHTGGTFERPSSSSTSQNGNGTSQGRSQGFDANTHAAPNNAGNNTSGRGTFAPESRQSSQGAPSGTSERGGAENRGSWQHFTPPSSASRGSASNSYSRPSINMRQPIVTSRGGANGYNSPRSSGTYNAPRGGGYNGSYNAPRQTYNAPRSNGTYSAPRSGRGAPSRSGGGASSNRGGGSGHSGGHAR